MPKGGALSREHDSDYFGNELKYSVIYTLCILIALIIKDLSDPDVVLENVFRFSSD